MSPETLRTIMYVVGALISIILMVILAFRVGFIYGIRSERDRIMAMHQEGRKYG